MKKITFLSLMLASSVSFAAIDGTPGGTSQGQLDVNLNKGNEVRISNLTDVNFGGQTSAPADKFIDVCLYSTTGSYDITATSNYGSGNTFRLANAGATNFINYDLEWNDQALGTAGQDLQNGTTSPKFNNANTSQNDCGGGVNSRLFVEISGGSFNNAPAGSYSDTLTLVVSPR